MTAEFLWINISLMALFFARTMPAYLRKRATPGMPARRALTSEDAERRELIGAGRS